MEELECPRLLLLLFDDFLLVCLLFLRFSRLRDLLLPKLELLDRLRLLELL